MSSYSVLTRIILAVGAVVCGFVGLLIATESSLFFEGLAGVGFLAVAGWMLLISVKPEYDKVNRGETP